VKPTADAVDTGALGVRQLRGRAVLATFGDLVLVCAPSPEQRAGIGALVGVLAEAAGAHPAGQHLSRLLAGLLTAAGPDEFPALCAFGPTDGGVAAIVHGLAELTITGAAGEVRLDGRDAVTLVDRVVPEPIGSIRAVLGDHDTDLLIDGWPGTGTTGRRTAAPRAAAPRPAAAKPARGRTRPAAVDRAADPTPDPTPEPAPVAANPTPDLVPVAADPTPPPVPDPTPDTVAVPLAVPLPACKPPPLPAAGGPDGSQVLGVLCKNGHFNDPTVAYCSVCGISMGQGDRVPVYGRRPQLGVLVVDDGTMSPLARDHVLGSAPDSDQAVTGGRATALRLLDPMVAAVHARVVLDEWDVQVVDAGSDYGTFLCGPGQSQWTRLGRRASAQLRPGTVLAVGRRQICYHSYRNPARSTTLVTASSGSAAT